MSTELAVLGAQGWCSLYNYIGTSDVGLPVPMSLRLPSAWSSHRHTHSRPQPPTVQSNSLPNRWNNQGLSRVCHKISVGPSKCCRLCPSCNEKLISAPSDGEERWIRALVAADPPPEVVDWHPCPTTPLGVVSAVYWLVAGLSLEAPFFLRRQSFWRSIGGSCTCRSEFDTPALPQLRPR